MLPAGTSDFQAVVFDYCIAVDQPVGDRSFDIARGKRRFFERYFDFLQKNIQVVLYRSKAIHKNMSCNSKLNLVWCDFCWLQKELLVVCFPNSRKVRVVYYYIFMVS